MTFDTQTLPSEEFPPLTYTQASIQHSSSSTQIPSFKLSEHFQTSLTMNNNDKGKALQILNDSNSIQLTNFSHEPLLFYLRDHELYFTSFYGPRYNESAIFIDYQEWYNSSEISFYSYLKLIKAYQTLVQDVNNHPVLIIISTEYINYFKWFHKQFKYWTTFEPYIFKFVSKVFPDVHICPVDQSYTQVLIPLQYPFQINASCLVPTKYGLCCKFLQDDYLHFRY